MDDLSYELAILSEERAGIPQPGTTRGHPTLRKGVVTTSSPFQVDGLPASNVYGRPLPAGTVVWMLVDAGRRLVFGPATAGAVSRVRFTENGTFTKASFPRFTAAYVDLVGGGGRGGNAAGGSGQAEGGGGAAGGRARSLLAWADIPGSVPVTVGSGGSGTGSSPAGGGTTSFGSVLSASGGAGGVTGANTTGSNNTAGGAGGVGSDGNLVAAQGQPGGNGRVLSGQAVLASHGGSSVFGAGGRTPGSAGSTAGQVNSGSGGSGAFAAGTTQVGGAGGSGLVVVEMIP